MKKKLVLKNKKRFTAFIASIIVLVLVTAFASNAYGYKEPSNKSIVVKRGDTLWDIAMENSNNGDIRDYIYKVKELNNMKTSEIYQGTVLIIPGS